MRTKCSPSACRKIWILSNECDTKSNPLKSTNVCLLCRACCWWQPDVWTASSPFSCRYSTLELYAYLSVWSGTLTASSSTSTASPRSSGLPVAAWPHGIRARKEHPPPGQAALMWQEKLCAPPKRQQSASIALFYVKAGVTGPHPISFKQRQIKACMH